MTRELDVDRVLEDWLAEGPSRLPDQAIEHTIDQLDHVRQRRPSWLRGSIRMHRLALTATGSIAAVAIGVAALLSITGDRGVGGPDDPPGTPFTSQRHGYTVILPENEWTAEERLGTRELGDFFDANSISGVDYFDRLDPDHGPALYVYLNSQSLEGLTFEDWVATHDAATAERAGCFELTGDYDSTVVDGEPARIAAHTCETWFGAEDGAWTTVQTLVAHGGRGYAIYLWPVDGGSAIPLEDLRAEAADWLSRIRFTN